MEIREIYIRSMRALRPPPLSAPLCQARRTPCGAKGPQYARVGTFYTKCHSVYLYNPPSTIGIAVYSM